MNTVIQDLDEVITWLPIEWFIPDPDAPNPRKFITPKSVVGLAKSIKRVGIQYPIICRQLGDEFPIIDGARRLAAAKSIGLPRVPARVLRDELTIAEVRARSMICNFQRLDLNPLEKAEGLQNFMAVTGFTADQAAENLGLSPATVCKSLTVLKLPESLRALVAEKTISADAAYMLGRVDDPDRQADLARRVAAGDLTRDALATEVGKRTASKSATPKAVSAGWRMTRTIAPGVALAVSGANLSLDALLAVLTEFIERGRAAVVGNVKLPQFLSQFGARTDAPSMSTRPGGAA